MWVRVPICIYTGYYESKATEGGAVDYEALVSAMRGTDILVYGRDADTVHEEAPLELATELLADMKDGSESEKVGDATFCLLTGELICGGSRISSDLAIKAADLGYANIAKPVIEKLFAAGYPPSEAIFEKIVHEGINRVLHLCEGVTKGGDGSEHCGR